MGQEQWYTNHDDFQVLEFYWNFYTVKRWNRECTFQIQTPNSLSISAQVFPRMNTDSWVTVLIKYFNFITIKYQNQL